MVNAQRDPKNPHYDSFDAEEWWARCSHPIYHKRLVVTEEFLRRNNIPHVLVHQRATDLVWVAPHVSHQVINLRPKLAEAVNGGGRLWNCTRGVHSPCGCSPPQGLATKDFIHNPEEDVTIVKRHRRIYECGVGSCHATFRIKRTLRSHIRCHVDCGHPMDVELVDVVLPTLTELSQPSASRESQQQAVFCKEIGIHFSCLVTSGAILLDLRRWCAWISTSSPHSALPWSS